MAESLKEKKAGAHSRCFIQQLGKEHGFIAREEVAQENVFGTEACWGKKRKGKRGWAEGGGGGGKWQSIWSSACDQHGLGELDCFTAGRSPCSVAQR